jgi:DNA topoisomerase-1
VGTAVKVDDAAPVATAVAHADAASLRYVSDARPGIRRRRAGAGFTYIAPNGSRVRDAATLERIRAIGIPPAWTEVWICPSANGHLQATGRDAKGRKQHRYHARWRAVRDENKYGRLARFARALPAVRQRVAADLAAPGMPRERVLAMVVWLLETTYIRIGNEQYARSNGSYGLTTLTDDHVQVRGARVRFAFRGKSGKDHDIEITDRYLARLVKRSRDLPGEELFQYIDDNGDPHPVDSGEVNAYIREIAGEEFTAKDFRTWAGTRLATRALTAAARQAHAATITKAIITEAVRETAGQLGNTPTVCRKCYIHPRIFEAFQDEAMHARWTAIAARPRRIRGLSDEEAALVQFLEAESNSPD